MTEENAEESSSQEETKPIEKTEEGVPAPSLLQQSTAVAERMEAANQKREELLNRQEKMLSEQMLGGQTNAGQTPPKPKELTDEEYKDQILAGEKPQ